MSCASVSSWSPPSSRWIGSDALRIAFDSAAVLERALERYQLAVHPGADASVAHLGVHRVGEVDGSGAGGQPEHVPLRGEDVHLPRAQVIAQGVEELLRLLRLTLPVEQLAQPAHLLGHAARVGDGEVLALLVLP